MQAIIEEIKKDKKQRENEVSKLQNRVDKAQRELLDLQEEYENAVVDSAKGEYDDDTEDQEKIAKLDSIQNKIIAKEEEIRRRKGELRIFLQQPVSEKYEFTGIQEEWNAYIKRAKLEELRPVMDRMAEAKSLYEQAHSEYASLVRKYGNDFYALKNFIEKELQPGMKYDGFALIGDFKTEDEEKRCFFDRNNYRSIEKLSPPSRRYFYW